MSRLQPIKILLYKNERHIHMCDNAEILDPGLGQVLIDDKI